MSEDDLSQRDLSRIADADLTVAERRELERHLHDFMTRVHRRVGGKRATVSRSKRVSRWDPAAASGRGEATPKTSGSRR